MLVNLPKKIRPYFFVGKEMQSTSKRKWIFRSAMRKRSYYTSVLIIKKWIVQLDKNFVSMYRRYIDTKGETTFGVVNLNK